MITRVSKEHDQLITAMLRRLSRLLTLAWPLTVVCLSVIAVRSFAPELIANLQLNPQMKASCLVALGTVGFAAALSIAIGAITPAWWRRAILAIALAPAPVLLYTSGNIVAGCAAIGLIAPVLWLGREVTARVLRELDPIAEWVIGGTLGVGVLAVLGYILGYAAVLRARFIWPIMLALTLVLVRVSGRGLLEALAALLFWVKQSSSRSYERYLCVGLLVGYFWLNLVGAVAPEIMADAIRVRLAKAALVAEAGRFVVLPWPLGSAGLGELVYSVALSSGPLETGKILNFIIGLFCGAAVWALGRQLGGHRAGMVALLIFYTLPLAAWLSQTAYIDLFSTLFAIATGLVITVRKQFDWRSGIVGLAFIVAGLTTKISFVLVGTGLGIAIAGFALSRIRTLARPVIAGLATILIPLAVLSFARLYLEGSPRFATFRLFGMGHSLLALVRSPLDITFHTKHYSEAQDGLVGYLLLAFVPLVVIQRPNRRMVIILIGAISAYIVWFFSVQYIRYALPLLAICCAIAGSSYVAACRKSDNWAARAGMVGLLAVLAGLGLLGYLNNVAIYPGTQYRVALGLQDKAAYLGENVPEYTAVRLLDVETHASRLACGDCPALYTPIRFSNITTLFGNFKDESRLLGYLDKEKYSHILLNRSMWRREWDQATIYNEEFLRRNTDLVGGANNVYLYRIRPPDQRNQSVSWARGREILPNGGFEDGSSFPSGWVPVGQPFYDSTSQQSRNGRGAIHCGAQDFCYATVEAVPGTQYLYSLSIKSVDEGASARLQINWVSDTNTLLEVAFNVVHTNPRGYRSYSMLATAPPNTKWAMVYVFEQTGEGWFDDASLRSVASDQQPAPAAAIPSAAAIPPPQNTSPPVLRQLNPSSTQAGSGFNTQPDGQAALSVDCENASPGMVVVFNGKSLPTVYGNDHWVTATVSSELYQRAGRYEVYLRSGTRKSTKLIFTVNP